MLELKQARIKNEYLEMVTQLSKLDFLAIDDFGLMELDLDKCRDPFAADISLILMLYAPEDPVYKY